MSIEGTANCQILVSPFPTSVPQALQVHACADERRVLLIDSRKPNSLTILEEVRSELEKLGVPCEAIDRKKNPVGAEDSARAQTWSQFRGLLLFGIFD